MMKDIKSDDVQNRFTAYLWAAVTNNRNAYLHEQLRIKEMELVHEELWVIWKGRRSLRSWPRSWGAAVGSAWGGYHSGQSGCGTFFI